MKNVHKHVSDDNVQKKSVYVFLWKLIYVKNSIHRLKTHSNQYIVSTFFLPVMQDCIALQL